MICFFFSSRRRHTRSLCDWSSDVCSSDLVAMIPNETRARVQLTPAGTTPMTMELLAHLEMGGVELSPTFQLAQLTLKWRTSRSEEHTSELQSHSDLVCRLLLEKKKKYKQQ